MRTWIIPLAVLMVVPALGAAAPIYVPPVTEQLVEGHTVFTVIEQNINVTARRTEYNAAVAVLVRERNAIQATDRFPGVLWFNDQYLVDPVKSDVDAVNIRYPCTGAVLAVNAGDPDPRPAFTFGVPTLASYIESYLITDPNDHTWNVDKWLWAGPLGTNLVWTVAILANDAGYNTPDDGFSNCTPFADSVLYNANDQRAADPTIPRTGPTCGVPAPIPWSRAAPVQPNTCNTYTTGRTDTHPRLLYNALLYFFIDDLTIAGADKDHQAGSADSLEDGSGCEAGTEWACPSGAVQDDNNEGNSHPYNPFEGLPVCVHCTGSGNHGGSAAGGDQYQHATRNIDLYYGIGELPAVRNLRVVDTEGSLAPYHCHNDQALDAYHPDSDLICDDGY